MRDEHCHIIWGVDDGSESREMTAQMVERARSCGFTDIVCTPHMRWDDFDRAKVERHFAELSQMAPDISWTLGFEVYFKRLERIGFEHAREFTLGESDVILIEFDTGGTVPDDWERAFYRLQTEQALDIVLAHPERYTSVLDDFELLYRMQDAGVKFQVSAGDALGGPFNKTVSCARRIVREGLCHALVTDAHRPEHYDHYSKAARKLGWG